MSQVFSCELFKIFKNAFFTQHLRVTVSVLLIVIFWKHNHGKLWSLRCFLIFSYGNQSIELFLGKGVLIMQPMQLQPMNCLSVFDHFVGLALKGWTHFNSVLHFILNILRKIFRKTNIYYPLIRTRRCVYQGVINVSFSEIFAFVLNKWSLTW